MAKQHLETPPRTLLTPISKVLRVVPPSRNKGRLGRVITKLLIHGRMNSIAQVKMLDGSTLLLDARSRTEAGAFWNGERDKDDIDFFKVCLSRGDTCFDVGANVGMIATPMACHLRDLGGGKVIAFEPVKSNFERLQKIVALNNLESILFPFNLALGDEEGEIEIALETRGGASTGNAVMSKIADNLAEHTVSKARIVPLDDFVKEQGIERVDFIKVDIEGAELLFLQGGVNFLSKSRPVIYGEFHSGMMPKFGHNFLDVIEFFKPLNYRVFAFKNRLQPVEILEPKVGMGNVFFVPAEKTEELLQRVETARKKG